MRYVCSMVALSAISLLAPKAVFGQGGSAGLSVTNYQLAGERRISATSYEYTYFADLVNTGGPRTAVTATVTSNAPNITVIGAGNLHFAPVPSNGQVRSLDTFTILVDRSVPFSLASLQWTFLAPVANAGPNQTAAVGSTVTLNGSGSSNPSGFGTLFYSWTFVSRPAGTSTRLPNASVVMPTFVVDVAGTYVLRLTVTNGAGSDSATVTISTGNSPPVANAGPNQTVAAGATVTLNGTGSSDVDGDPLTYAWTLITRPVGSTAVLTNATSVSPAFVADKPGSYTAQLVVRDGKVNSPPDTVVITTQNTPPVANAGPGQTVTIGALVQLNGSASTDVDGDTLTYQWSLITLPAGSTAVISNAALVNPTFRADRAGAYVAQLVVSDGKGNSPPATVTVTTGGTQAPTANAGINQTVKHGAQVTLTGSGTDPQSRPLTFLWSLTTRPAGSAATLSSTTSATPNFVADIPGLYVAQLIVNNGIVSSAPSTVTITTTNSAPVANAGPSQNVPVGVTVTLNGSASSDSDQDPLSYSWTFTSRPAGSTATLSAANSASPTFFANLAGTYVAQLIVNDGFANSAPATVTINVSATTITLSPDTLNLFNTPGTMTVAIGAPAGPGGQQVRLAILDPSIASVPATVTIAENTSSANFTVSPLALGGTLLTASLPGFRPGTATINVANPSITLATETGTVGVTRSIGGTVTLSAPAPAGGATVSLTANPVGIVSLQPNAVVIAQGNKTGTFTVTGVAQGTATIAASSAGYVSGATPISVGQLGSISLQPNVTVGPGQSVPIAVTLATPAPQGGVTIALVSSDPSKATVTPTVTIPQGAVTPAAQPQVSGVAFGSTTISASAPGFTGTSQLVRVAANLSFAPSALTVGVGATQNLTLTLSSPAPAGGLLVTLNSTNAAASVPASVTIPQGATSVPVAVTGVSAGAATITANPSSSSVVGTSAPITVLVFGSIGLPANLSLLVGQTVPFPVTLSGNAPAGGVTVTLNLSNSARAQLSSVSLNIPAGARIPAVQPQISALAVGSVLVTASAPGFGSASQTVQITGSLQFAAQTLTITGTATQNLTLSVSSPAPAGGLTINLNSSNPGAATVPATVNLAQGATSVQVPVTGVAAGSTVIRATATNLAQATANVTVNAVGGIILPANLNLGPGQSAAFAVTLPTPATSNVTVTLVSSDRSKVTIAPPTVSIAAGQTQPAQQPLVTGVNFGSASISATAPGFAGGVRTVTVTASLSFVPPATTIVGAGTRTVSLNLSAPAPAGGVAVALTSSNPSIVSAPASVTIAAGATSVPVQLTSGLPGAATITAVPNTQSVSNATTVVTVQGSGSIGLPPAATVAIGQTIAFPILLPTAAPVGGVTVSLVSSQTSRVTITPASVVIPAGQVQPSVQPQIRGVGLGSATITATATGYGSASQTVLVTGTIALTPINFTISGIGTQNLTLTLSTAAPAGGLVVTLTSSNPAVATVPNSVVVPQNATTVPVPVTSKAPGSTVIQATTATVGQASANVTVQASSDIILPVNLVVAPGNSVSFPVTLARPATQPTFITLTSSDPARLTVSQQNIFINTGLTQPASQPLVTGISAGPVNVTATAIGLADASTSVQVGFGLTFTPNTLTVTGTATQNLSLTLSSVAPAGGITVTLSSSNPAAATVPASVFISAGSSSVNVPVKGVAPGTTAIQASAANITPATASVTVVNPGTISLPANLTVALGRTVPFPITLSTPAPAGGVTLSLSSSDTAKLTVSPASVFVTAGQTQPAAQPAVTGVNVGPANVNVSAPAYTAATATLQVQATVAWTQANVSVNQGSTQNLLLALSASAPLAGLSVSLNSSNPSVAAVQQSVNFFPDGSEFTTVVIPVTGLSPGTTLIRASGLNIPNATVSVTVLGPLRVATTALPNAIVGAPYSQTLAAAGGRSPYTWALASGALPAGLTLNGATGVLSGTATTAAANIPLTFRVTDSSTTPQTATASLPLSVVVRVATSITATGGTPQSAAVTKPFGAALAATVRDAANNPVAGVTVTFTAPATGASGTFAGGLRTAISNASGVASSAVFTANGVIGTYAVTASVAGVATPASFALTNTVGSAASIAATSGTPQSVAVTKPFAPFVVTVKDAGDNPVSGVTVTFAVPLSGARGSFAGGVNTAVTNASGVATSAIFTANGTIGGYTVAASVAGVATPANFALTNTVGPPAAITATGGTPQSIAVTKPFASRLLATVKDAGGNPVSGATVTFAAPASGASGSFAGGATTAVTNASGVATSAVFTANATIGAYTVSASVPGVATPAAFALTNTVGPPATIAATGGTPQSVAVTRPFASPLIATVKDAGGNPVSGVTVTFTVPASVATGTFAGGVRTAVTNASGVATSAIFTANGKIGSYTVTAAVAGVPTPASFALTNTIGPPASITATSGTPQSAAVTQAFGSPLVATVKDAGGNPISGVTVTFNVPASGASGNFASGANTRVTNASGVATSVPFTANGTAGSYIVSATVAGVATPANFALNNTLSTPASIVATSGTPQNTLAGTTFGAPLVATVRDTNGNPVSGASVVFTAPSSGASATFAGGVRTAVTNASGVAASVALTANSTAGNYTVSASVSGVAAPATFSLTNLPTSGGGPQITITGAAVGQNLQTPVSVSIPNPAPVGGLGLIISVNNANLIRVAGRPGDPGTAQISVRILEGLTTVSGIFVRGLASTGSAQITATATGYSTGLATIPLAPSGFVLAGPNGIGSAFSTPQGATTQLTVSSARLDQSLNFVELQAIRGDLSVQVPISNTTPSVGTVTPQLVSISGGQAGGTANFNALATGGTTLTAGAPADFSQAAPGVSSLIATVTPAALVTTNVTLGENLQSVLSVRLNSPAPPGGLLLTIVSNDAAKVKFSTSAIAEGSGSITLNVEGGRTTTQDFYVQGLASAGSVNYSATASGYGSATGTVTLTPSGFVVAGPFGTGADFFTTSGAENSDLTVYAARLTPARAYVEPQPVRGGLSVNVQVTSSNPSVGTITTSPVNFTGGISSRGAQFNPSSAGLAAVSLNTPAGFSAPLQFSSLTVTVRTPQLQVEDNVVIGKNLQAFGSLLLGQAAPAGGLTVTLTSGSSQLLLASSETAAGATSLAIQVPAGQSSAVYFLQARGDSGTASYTAAAPGYLSKSGTVILNPSGVVIAGQFGFGFPVVTTLAGGSRPVSVITALLDPATQAFVRTQPLSGGLSLSVALENTSPEIGTVSSPVTIAGGTDTANTDFVPLSVGQTLLTVIPPAGYTASTDKITVLARVN